MGLSRPDHQSHVDHSRELCPSPRPTWSHSGLLHVGIRGGPEWVLESRQEALEAVRMRDVSNVEETGMFSR